MTPMGLHNESMARGKGRTQYRFGRLEFFLLILTLLTIGAAVWVGWVRSSHRTSIEVLEDKVLALRRLSTVSQSYRDVIYSQERRFLIAEKRLLFTLNYDVTAGVDFSRGMEMQALPEGGVLVRMPSAEIFDVDADDESIQQIFIMERLDAVRLGDYMPLILESGRTIRQAALDSGILDIAEANAKRAVTRILSVAGVTPVVFGNPLPIASLQVEVDDGP